MLRKGVGVATLFNDVHQCRQLSYGKCGSFQHVALQLGSSCQAILVTIYRPLKYNPKDGSVKELLYNLDNFGLST